MWAMTMTAFWLEILKGRKRWLVLNCIIIRNWKSEEHDVRMWAVLVWHNHRLTQKAGNSLSSWASSNFSRKDVPSRVSLLVGSPTGYVWHVLDPCTCGRNFAAPEYKEMFHCFLYMKVTWNCDENKFPVRRKWTNRIYYARSSLWVTMYSTWWHSGQ